MRRGADTAGLWRFSLALYARPGVADALMALQDRHGHHVNLILAAVWFGAARGTRLGQTALAAAAAAAPAEAALVRQLRDWRRRLKRADEPTLRSLRHRIAALELAAERQVQHRLAAALSGMPGATATTTDRWSAAMGNLEFCLGDAAASSEAAVLRRALTGLMRRPWPDIDPPIPGDDKRKSRARD